MSSKHFLICNSLLSVAIAAYEFFNRETWIALFESLQKISLIIYKAKCNNGAISSTAFHLSIIGERVLDSLKNAAAKPSLQVENSRSSVAESQHSVELVAGTGEQDYGPSAQQDTNSQMEEVKVNYETINNPLNKTTLLRANTKFSETASVHCKGFLHLVAVETDNALDTIPDSLYPRAKEDSQAKVSAEVQTLMSLIESLFTFTKTFPVLRPSPV